MNTSEIVALALEMAGMTTLPGDSAVHLDGRGIRRALVGLDLGVPELQWAKGEGFDLALAHHPMGGDARLGFHEVYRDHIPQMAKAGVPLADAQNAVLPEAERLKDAALTANIDHIPSFARLIGLPCLNLHQPLDEIGRNRYQAVFESLGSGAEVGELMGAVRGAFSEYRHLPASLRVSMGRADAPVGVLAWSHAAGTNPGRAGADAYFEAGVDTLALIHYRGDLGSLKERWGGEGKNLLVMGHLVADSVGINPFLTALERKGVGVERCSGVLAP